MQSPCVTPAPILLGIEGGATRTVALLVDGSRSARFEGGPGNLRLLSDRQLRSLLRGIADRFPHPHAIGIGLAGARNQADRDRIHRVASRIWPGVPCVAGNDLQSALAAATPRRLGRGTDAVAKPRVLVLSGTGSCCFGTSAAGRTAKIGGWGHLLGDLGSGYDIAWRGLRAVIHEYDREQVWSRLGQRLLRALQLNEPEDIITWMQQSLKPEVAALAVEVFAAQAEGDRLARAVLLEAAGSLAADAVVCARRLAGKGRPVEFVLAGGVLLRQSRFARAVARRIRAAWPNAIIRPLDREGAWGAVEMARGSLPGSQSRPALASVPQAVHSQAPAADLANRLPDLESLQSSPTERRNPRSRHLDRLPLHAAIGLMLSEDAKIPRALLAESAGIETTIRWVASAFRRGGRLFYVGAGTSGRLGVLDASECPPTFGTPPEWVQAIMAGGQRALWEAVEGAEDRLEAGAAAVEFRGVKSGDVVLGIAASGGTPFVWGALWKARQLGARTILLCFNPGLRVAPRDRPDLVIAPDLGPEVLTGSTRLKAGTATKLVLNLITTLAMVRLGKVVGNLMVDLNPSNAKLRNRAVRIVRTLTGATEPVARAALERHGWVVKQAIHEARRWQAES